LCPIGFPPAELLVGDQAIALSQIAEVMRRLKVARMVGSAMLARLDVVDHKSLRVKALVVVTDRRVDALETELAGPVELLGECQLVVGADPRREFRARNGTVARRDAPSWTRFPQVRSFSTTGIRGSSGSSAP